MPRNLHERTRDIARRYMFDVAQRFDRVLDLTGRRPGPLATLFLRNFVGMAKRCNVSRDAATRKLHEVWEAFDRAEMTEDIAADVKSDA